MCDSVCWTTLVSVKSVVSFACGIAEAWGGGGGEVALTVFPWRLSTRPCAVLSISSAIPRRRGGRKAKRRRRGGLRAGWLCRRRPPPWVPPVRGGGGGSCGEDQWRHWRC